MNAEYESILTELAESPLQGRAIRRRAMELLDGLDGFDWSGIYALHGAELHLDEYVGAHTDHTVIPVGRGVCGTAIAEDKNQLIEDVRELENYLACSLQTRSEIVVLIRRGDEVLGQIDIDGHQVGRFGVEEETLLNRMAELLADRWETTPPEKNA